MDIRKLGTCEDQFGLDRTTMFCVDEKCHVEVKVGAHFEDDIPEGANALKYIDGTASAWKVGPCDGSCRPAKPFPQCIMNDVLAFLKDGKNRKGELDGDVLDPGD